VTACGDLSAVEGVKLTEQIAAARSQLLDENTPGPSLDQEMVPDGLAPDTVAVKVVGLPDETELGLAWTVVVVAGNG